MKKKWSSDEHLARWLNRKESGMEGAAWQEGGPPPDLKRILDVADGFEVPARLSQAEAWETLQHRIATEAPPKYPPVIRTLRPPQVVWLGAAAAALALLVLAAWWWQPTRLRTDPGETLTAVLPDSSQVRLNGDSELAYQADEWPEARNLTLKGEAFFEVKEGSFFTVRTEHGTVVVKGTKFNVFVRDAHLAVGCYEGKVEVRLPNTDTQPVLTAGNFLQKSGTDSAIIRNLKGSLSPGWLTGTYRYVDAPLSEVLSEIGRRYHIVFQLDDDIDPEVRFSGKFEYQTEARDQTDRLAKTLELVIPTVGYRYHLQRDTCRIYR